MEKWFKTCLLVCLIGFFQEFRPDESFAVEYLTGPWHNLTVEEITQSIYPVWTYSLLPMTIIAFLLTDYLLYKPIIIFQNVCFTIYYALYTFGRSIPLLQVAQFFSACGTASDIAYCTYLFVQVPKEKFLFVTAYIQAAWMIGYGVSQILGQILISTDTCNYLELNYITLSFSTVSVLIACFIPSAKESFYFHRGGKQITENDHQSTNSSEGLTPTSGQKKEVTSPWSLLWIDFVYSFSTLYMLKWTFWLALSIAFFDIAYTYTQALWSVVDTGELVYNGAIDAAQVLLSSFACLALGYAPTIDWVAFGNLSIVVIALLEATVFILMSTASSIWVSYVGFILHNIFINLTITIARAESAKGLKEESYGLVYGITLLIGHLMETILIIIVVDDIGLGLGPREQYAVYSGIFAGTGICFLGVTAYQRGRLSH